MLEWWFAIPGLAVIIFLIYWLFGLGKTIYCGPTLEALVMGSLETRLRLVHSAAAFAALSAGLAIGSVALIVPGLIVTVVMGVPVGYWWGHIRMRGASSERGGPDDTVPDAQLFPSDRGARLFFSGIAPRLPIWVDMLMISGCCILGLLLGKLLHAVLRASL